MRSLLGTLVNKAPVPYSADGGGIVGLFTGSRGGNKTEQLQAMGTVGTLFSIVHALSTAVAAVDWHMHRIMAPGSGDSCPMCDAENVELITDHQALRLINRPNDFTTRTDLFETGQQHSDLTGETWLLVERLGPGSLPIGLWNIRPDRMAVVPSATEFIAGYVYTGPNGEKVPLEVQDVIRHRLPDPEDPYRGMGPVQAIMRDIDSARYGSEWNRNFFLNSAEPGGIIQTENELTDAQWNRLVTRWREGHKGVHNAHRVAVLEGHKWVDRSFSPRDIQFKDLREVSRDVMLEAYGMSKFGIGIIDDVNRATAEAAIAWFAQQMTVPRLSRWKTMFNTYLLPMLAADPRRVEVVPNNPVPPDSESINAERDSKTAAWSVLVAAGADPDDAADYCGLPRMKMAPKPQPPALPPGQDAPPAIDQPGNRVVLPFVPRPPKSSRRTSSLT